MGLKLIYVVLDGAADRPQDSPTSYEAAETPNLDELARRGICGAVYTIGKGIAPESDTAVLSILGYDPHRYYTGRGPLEALGLGIRIKEGREIAFRANFATIDENTGRLIDRRCGRDIASEEARELAKSLDGMELGLHEGYVRVLATIGHRAVVIIGSEKYNLSDKVTNTDPAYVRVGDISVAAKEFRPYIKECRPLEETDEARRAAELVNVFSRKAMELLKDHPINKRREAEGRLKANAILLRDCGGRLPKVVPISEVFNRRFAAITEMPVEKGIARLLGMDIGEVPPPSADKKKDYELRLDVALRLLRRNDAVYVHLKGPDEPGHDGDFKRKVKAIEMIDKHFIGPLLERIDLSEYCLLITSDHATPWRLRTHTDDPVPVIFVSPNTEPDSVTRISERECIERGSLGVIDHGWELLPTVLRMC
ncbi:MAG: 2,3-bisphosphoglycerate-independent phosphoglycerate mutase [Thermoprotei archaeon]|nr:2,3-bisphosphoglycerate-independent phosphoglycerate mutase [Thermoprotei archaeon]